MDSTLRLALTILGFVFAGIGLVVVYLAPKIVRHYGLADKKKLDDKIMAVLSAEEQAQRKLDSAILDVKIKGLILSAPGFILILIVFG